MNINTEKQKSEESVETGESQNTQVNLEENEVSIPLNTQMEALKTYLSFEMDSVKYTVEKAEVLPFQEYSSNYEENGETNLLFMGPVLENSDMGINVAITFSGKNEGVFEGKIDPVPFSNPLFNVGISDFKNNISTTFVSTSENDGAPLKLEITRFDDEAIQGKFSGSVSELSIEGLNLNNKRKIENGTFTIFLK